ncbi:transcription factor [Babesia caballi]|uniref:Transcription factor n=1 Tax=Babesia caballi TaxID=5871 RepID=A0AAV4LWM3_BABCB|nr:transcription factor [Babesia caballi]
MAEIDAKELELLPVKLVQQALNKGLLESAAMGAVNETRMKRGAKRAVRYTLKQKKFAKDAVNTVNRAAGLFVLYMAAVAQDIAKSKKRTTVCQTDIVEALKAGLFGEIEREMSAEGAAVNELLKVRQAQMLSAEEGGEGDEPTADGAGAGDGDGAEGGDQGDDDLEVEDMEEEYFEEADDVVEDMEVDEYMEEDESDHMMAVDGEGAMEDVADDGEKNVETQGGGSGDHMEVVYADEEPGSEKGDQATTLGQGETQLAESGRSQSVHTENRAEAPTQVM